MLNLIQNQTLRKVMVSAIASSTVFGVSSTTTAAMPMAFSRALGLRSALTFSTGFPIKPFSSSSSSLFTFSSSRSLRVSCSSLLQSPFAAICHEVLQCKRQSIRCKVTRSGDAGYSPVSSNSNWSDRPPTEMAPLFPGCDYEHWLIVMDPLNDGKATKEEMIDHYIKTLAKVLGGFNCEDAAKKSIYNVSCERYYGFGCQIDEETSTKLEGLPGVCFVLPDSYVDVENKDYGAELLVDGKIVERSPERQRVLLHNLCGTTVIDPDTMIEQDMSDDERIRVKVDEQHYFPSELESIQEWFNLTRTPPFHQCDLIEMAFIPF